MLDLEYQFNITPDQDNDADNQTQRGYWITQYPTNREDFLDANVRKLENWALDKIAARSGLVESRSVTEIAFHMGRREIDIRVVEFIR